MSSLSSTVPSLSETRTATMFASGPVCRTMPLTNVP